MFPKCLIKWQRYGPAWSPFLRGLISGAVCGHVLVAPIESLTLDSNFMRAEKEWGVDPPTFTWVARGCPYVTCHFLWNCCLWTCMRSMYCLQIWLTSACLVFNLSNEQVSVEAISLNLCSRELGNILSEVTCSHWTKPRSSAVDSHKNNVDFFLHRQIIQLEAA